MPTLGEQLEAPQLTLHINMSVAQLKTLSQHQRMNLQHAVQHLLNVSLTKLHTNKLAGTHGLTPILAYFDIIHRRIGLLGACMRLMG